MLKLRLLLFFLIALQGSSFSQILKGHYMPFGLGYAFQTVKDNSISPISYSGSLGHISSGYYSQNEKWLSLLDISGFSGFQRPDVNPEENDSRITLISARAIYSFSRQVLQKGDWHFFAGLLSHNVWDYRDINRYSNSSSNFNGFFSLGIQLTTQREFQVFGESFGFQYALGLPVGSYYLRPGYIKPLLNDKVSAKGLAFWDEFYLLDSRADLFWKLNELNYLRLSYQWEYARHSTPNKIQSANHFLSVSTIFRF